MEEHAAKHARTGQYIYRRQDLRRKEEKRGEGENVGKKNKNK
jgi:hypothetical protein